MNEFNEYYRKEKILINEKLKEFNKQLVKEDNPIIKENLELLRNLNSDGKLIRGTLVNLGYYLLKDNKEYSNNLSLAYELFQTAILVHDDIIDSDNKRRGKDTIHYATIKNYNKYTKDHQELKKLGESVAICMGDYGLYLANQMIVTSYSNDKNLPKILNYFNSTVLKTIKGELLDVVLPFKSKYDKIDKDLEKYIINIYLLKTAHYTIIGPLEVGLILAGADNNKLKDIQEFGKQVGIAFQIQDDILGIYSEETGKIEGSDIKEFKQTILYSYTCNTKYKDELLKYYGKENLSKEAINKVKEIFNSSGATSYALNMMNKLYDNSLSTLEKINWISEDKKILLKGFVEYLRTRNK